MQLRKGKDITGQVFGKLLAVSYLEKSKNGRVVWQCNCACGKQTTAYSTDLRLGRKTSCGCLNVPGEGHRFYKHGKSESKVFNTWRQIKDRCLNPNNKSYCDYGEVGVTVADCYLNNFEAFYKDVGDPPSLKHSIDRIDPKRGYEPGNLRWVTLEYQQRNKRLSRKNTSGVTGVSFARGSNPKNTDTYVVAQWRSLEGKQKAKSFSVRKLGLMPAFKAAVEYRRKMIEELNAQGAGYTENHGK